MISMAPRQVGGLGRSHSRRQSRFKGKITGSVWEVI